MDNKRARDVPPALFVIMIILLYGFMKVGLFASYFSYFFIAILVLEVVSILISSYGIFTSSIPYFLLIIRNLPYVISLPLNLIYLMIILSLLIVPSRLFLKRGNISPYISFASLTLLYHFYGYTIYGHLFYYLLIIVFIFIASYFLSPRSDSFVSYLISFFLLISLISMPSAYYDGIINISFPSVYNLSLLIIAALAMIVFLQDLLYDKTVPYLGISMAVLIILVIQFISLPLLILIFLIILITLGFSISVSRFIAKHDADSSAYGISLMLYILIIPLKDFYLLTSLLFSYIIFYIIVKKYKKLKK